jgi:hypothetical protein
MFEYEVSDGRKIKFCLHPQTSFGELSPSFILISIKKIFFIFESPNRIIPKKILFTNQIDIHIEKVTNVPPDALANEGCSLCEETQFF